MFTKLLDDNFFKPVAKGWRKIPDIPRKPLSNLASTAQAPISLANAVLQLNRESIGNILAKFLLTFLFLSFEPIPQLRLLYIPFDLPPILLKKPWTKFF